MPELHPTPAPAEATEAPAPDAEDRAAFAAAAAAVLALKFNRPTLRPERVQARPAVALRFAQQAVPAALRAHRALREETALVLLAGAAAEHVKFGGAPDPAALDAARALLAASAPSDDEADPDVVEASLTVLTARARAELRRAWAEVEIVAIGLRAHGALDGVEVEHRVRCAQGIRSAALN